MKGYLIVNKYYTDAGMEYIYSRLEAECTKRKVDLIKIKNTFLCYNEFGNQLRDILDGDFVIYFDKDISICKAIEKYMPVFNNSFALEMCDDKEKTYNIISNNGIDIPRTVLPPLSYDNNFIIDEDMLKEIALYLKYPIIVKDTVGSQGKQVYLCNDYEQLKQKHSELLHKRHIFQQFVGDEHGVDIRMYVVGGKFIASCKRENTTSYKSNLFLGGTVSGYTPEKSLIEKAEKIAKLLKLDYGAIDFLPGSEVFIEANSNAYFKGIESLGFNIAGAIVDNILRELENVRR